MDKSRIAIIVLILIAIIFAIGIGMGFSGEEDKGPNIDDEESVKNYVKNKIPSSIKNIGEMFGSGGDKLGAEDFSTPTFNEPTVTISFGKDAPVVAQIRASESKYRKATFKLVSGIGARIQYFPVAIPDEIEDRRTREKLRDENLIDLSLSPKTPHTGKCDEDDGSCKQLNIFQKGGRLELTCKGDTPCRVDLQK